MRRTVIAIDPDICRSGVAVLEPEGGVLEVHALSFPELCSFCRSRADARFYVEAGWQVQKSNFHGHRGPKAERIAHDVGENHATGKLLLQMLEAWGMDCSAVHPLRKVWTGPQGKITAAELARLLANAGLQMKSRYNNQDTRDAALLCLVCAGIPLRM